MTVHEQLCFITTRIETYNKGDVQATVGTGFFWEFNLQLTYIKFLEF